VDPDKDLDPAFQVNPDPDPIRTQSFDDRQKPKERNIAEFFSSSFFDQKLQLLISKLQEKPSTLKREHPTP
jgi:hypothetical protein